MAHFRLLRQPYITHSLPVVIYQPVLCIGQYRAGSLVLQNKEFKFIAIRSFVIQITAGTGAVIAALSGAGLYALLITPIVSSILIYIISFHRYPQHLRMTLGLSSIRKIFSYSVYQFLFNVICYFSRNLDKLLIGNIWECPTSDITRNPTAS